MLFFISIALLALEVLNVSGAYTYSNPAGTTSLLVFIKSRPDLSLLAQALQEPLGFSTAFDRVPIGYNFTFFAPNNDAFNNVSSNLNVFWARPKGKESLGNTLIGHYVPLSAIPSTAINGTYRHLQTATFLYLGLQKTETDDLIQVNRGQARVVEADLNGATGGLVHIIDRVLSIATTLYEPDSAAVIPKIPQAFIPGSCSNPALPFC